MAFRQIPEVERADRDTDQAHDLYSQFLEHAADVAIAAFVERNLQPDMNATVTQNAGVTNAEGFMARADALTQAVDEFVGRGAAHLDVIALLQV